MSDWTGTNSVASSIRAGTDLEMPGPTKWRGKRVLESIARGELSRAEVEKAAGNVLYLVDRTKGLDGPPEPPERSIEDPATTELIRQAGVEGLTLLKNDGNLLPIKSDVKTIALIGPNVKRAIVGGGGSATLNPLYTVSPFEGIGEGTSADV